MLNICEESVQPKVSSLGLMGIQNGKPLKNNWAVHDKLNIHLPYERALKYLLK